MSHYTHATVEAGMSFYQNFNGKGEIVMLNLLKYRSVANYADFETLQPAKEISGEDAYQLYLQHTIPLFEKAGSKILYYGKCKDFLIGPQTEQWDAMLLVKHHSVAKFIEFAQSKDYIKIEGHRTAALEDARLLPSFETDITP
ncbi:uncharacterized protein DUF1330 [Dyadobacter jejuensis]|uniref:Uncharacterized protein DUF1330 n=1 Tax=Dyadobacter jejuensis TaxID=1082580 RepID=A0A316AKP0_9BACT|nr:DUF1330 domain-containing protein [Dyadobacter jejuensis]PWJ58062.1 uncharacterized protein DUF1330 [Dyadobacter jejuensis]